MASEGEMLLPFGWVEETLITEVRPSSKAPVPPVITNAAGQVRISVAASSP
jgi:hypothetical protein